MPFYLTENAYMFLRALTDAGLIKGWREGFSRPLAQLNDLAKNLTAVPRAAPG